MKLRPASWLPVTGNQVFTFVTSGSRGWAQHYAQSGASFIRVGNLDHDTIALDLNDVQCVQPPVGAEGERTRLQAHDVLVSITAEVGMVGLVPPGLGEAYINQHIALARPVPGLEPRFLAWYLASEADGKRSLLSSSRGGTKSGLGLDDIRQVEIPLAPLAEQQRIADKLDAVVARVDACRDRLARVAPLLKRFKQSVLDAAVSGRLTADWRKAHPMVSRHAQLAAKANAGDNTTKEIDPENPEGWRVLRAEEVVQSGANIVYGIVQPGPKLAAGVPYVQTTDIVNGRVQVDTLSFTSPEIAGDYQRSSIRTGDVLLGIIRATKVAVVPEGLQGANISRSVARLRPGNEVMSRYLAIALQSPNVQQWLRAQHRGMDMPVLNLAQVRQAPIPVAPRDEQTEVVRRVDSLFAFADRLEARLAKAQAAADRLTPALLAKAFRGELVPQDPTDEPAAVLLQRLATSRPAPATKTRRPRADQAG